MKSIWLKNTKEKNLTKPLKQFIKRDIVIVGGGIAGILAAYQLSKTNHKVTLLEAKQLYTQTTAHTTAHITALQGLIYQKIKKYHSLDSAKMYFDSQIEAIKEYEKLIEEHHIACDFCKVTDHLYTENNIERLKEEYQILNNWTSDISFEENKKCIGIQTKGCLTLPNQASFHPLKFLEQLPKNFEIIENCLIKKINKIKKLLYSDNLIIKANKIIIATNFPFINIPGFYFLRMYKSTSYAVSFPYHNILGMYQDDLENGYTFRNYQNNLIIGGLDHRTGRLKDANKYYELGNKLQIPFEQIEYYWATNDCITPDNLPFIGKYSIFLKDIYVITGFNKWGMTNSMIASILIKDLICQNKNKYEKLFTPFRLTNNIGSYFISMGINIVSLLKSFFSLPFDKIKNLKPETGKILFYQGKRRAIYKDIDNNIFICKHNCQHLHCSLEFNTQTKTWDCQCHGSRYDIEGNLLNGPSLKNLK